MTIFYIGWLNQESEKVVASSSALSSTLALRCRRNSQNAPRRRLQKHSRQHQPKVVRYHFLYPEYGRHIYTYPIGKAVNRLEHTKSPDQCAKNVHQANFDCEKLMWVV